MEFSVGSPATSGEIDLNADFPLPPVQPLFSGQEQSPVDCINSSYVAKAIRSAISNRQHADALVKFMCEKESILERSDLSFYAEAFYNKHHHSHSEILKIESMLTDQIALPAFVFARWKDILFSHQPHMLTNNVAVRTSSAPPPQFSKALPSTATIEFRKNVQDRLWKWCTSKANENPNLGRVADEIKQSFYDTNGTFKSTIIILPSAQNNKFQFNCPCCACLELDAANATVQAIYRHVAEVHLRISRADLLRNPKDEPDASSSSETHRHKRKKPFATVGLRQKQLRLPSDSPSAGSLSSPELSTVVPRPGPLTAIPSLDGSVAEVSVHQYKCCMTVIIMRLQVNTDHPETPAPSAPAPVTPAATASSLTTAADSMWRL